jgi:beta-xylosidase
MGYLYEREIRKIEQEVLVMVGEKAGECINCGRSVSESWQEYCRKCYYYWKSRGIDPAHFVDSAGRVWYRANNGWRWSSANKGKQ